MRTYLDCVPCFIRQALDSARFATDDQLIHQQVVKEVLRLEGDIDTYQSPVVMGQKIHRIVRQITENPDPYKQQKNRSNQLALRLYPEVKQKVREAQDPIEAAVRLAIAGNIIDFGVNGSLQETYIERVITESLTAEFDHGRLSKFKRSVNRAEKILYLGDNAGEIVFDRLLIEQLPLEKIAFVVKGSPVINDATMADAKAAGLVELVEVIDNGSDAPGTILQACSPMFRDRFYRADLIIAKGQGNYESLSDVNQNIFFILKVKCLVIAKDIDCQVGTMVLRGNRSCNGSISREKIQPRIIMMKRRRSFLYSKRCLELIPKPRKPAFSVTIPEGLG